ncbi:MAG: diguanylate cyclase [Nitrospirae bacterium]|nr:MAG: diguanylate cyclase [Nitrospirota bacterium]
MGAKGNINLLACTVDEETTGFVKGYFRGKRGLRLKHCGDIKTLKEMLKENHFDVLLIESPSCTSKLKNYSLQIPTIALVTDDVPKGLRDVIKLDIDYYLISPYHKEDFKLKLKSAIERKSWFKELYNEKRDLEAIIELTYLVSSTLEAKEVLYFIVKKLSEMIEVTRCSVISVGFGEKRYAHVVSSHEDPNITNIRLDLNKYPEIKKALQSKRSVIITDALSDPLMASVKDLIKPLGIRAIAVLPIIHRDEVIGTLFLRTSKKKRFTDREIRLCKAIANASSNALYNAFLFERLESEKERLKKLAITDYLTGVYNIRYFYHRLEEEFSRAQRYGNPVSCIMFDIDHFKKINDTYGHRTGDLVLREFAQLVRRHTRKSDVFARYGGEEFIMLLPQTSVEGALVEAERLREHIRNHRFKGIDRQITSSMGISCWPAHDVNTADDLITLADHALFRAKNTGRDRIEVSKKYPKKQK